MNQGCGRKWFATWDAADTRAGKIAGLGLAGGPAGYTVVPCFHGRGGFHLSPVTAEDTSTPPVQNRTARLPGEFTLKVKRSVRIRAGFGDPHEAVCEACGRQLGIDAGQYQHRYARGMGGCRLAVVNGPSGATLICGTAFPPTLCHGFCEARMPLMHDLGFWLKTGEDPRVTPITLHGRSGGLRQVWLPADGGAYLNERPVLEAAA